MAPRLGRGTVFAKFTREGGALITIELASPVTGRSCVELRAAPSQVNSMPSSGIHSLYRLSRHAISQVQHCVKGELVEGNDLELDCSNRPWNGDLAESPYGGATIGLQRIKHYVDHPPYNEFPRLFTFDVAAKFGRMQPVAAPAGFSTWQPAILGRSADFGQKRSLLQD